MKTCIEEMRTCIKDKREQQHNQPSIKHKPYRTRAMLLVNHSKMTKVNHLCWSLAAIIVSTLPLAFGWPDLRHRQAKKPSPIQTKITEVASKCASSSYLFEFKLSFTQHLLALYQSLALVGPASAQATSSLRPALMILSLSKVVATLVVVLAKLHWANISSKMVAIGSKA